MTDPRDLGPIAPTIDLRGPSPALHFKRRRVHDRRGWRAARVALWSKSVEVLVFQVTIKSLISASCWLFLESFLVGERVEQRHERGADAPGSRWLVRGAD